MCKCFCFHFVVTFIIIATAEILVALNFFLVLLYLFHLPQSRMFLSWITCTSELKIPFLRRVHHIIYFVVRRNTGSPNFLLSFFFIFSLCHLSQSRMFLSRITSELKIPVLGLVDSDPYGLKILSVYMSGSKNMSYDSASLTTPDIKWLGLRPSDLDKYDLPDQCRLDMTESDIKTGKELMQEEFIQKNPKWMKELQIMVKTKKKAEIQALSSFGFQYVTEQYLPRKIAEGDWI